MSRLSGVVYIAILMGACFVPFAVRGESPASEVPIVEILVSPSSISLQGPLSKFSLLVDGKRSDGRLIDLTSIAKFSSPNAAVVSVSPLGLVRGLADGNVTVEVEAAGKKVSVPVKVTGTTDSRQFNFENDIIPILSRFGCNTSGCHGKAEGQNGFKLSVFGFDPPADYAALTKEGRGRRVFPIDPDKSLLLAKASGKIPHGGGVRIGRTTEEYKAVRDWIAAGLPFGQSDDPHVVSIEVMPRERQMDMRSTQQVRVVATYSDGHQVDVSAHAKYQTNNEGLGSVNEHGLVTAGDIPGDMAVMASYMGAVDVYRAFIPRPERIENYPKLPEFNFVDGLVYHKLQKLNILPSELASDADFLRRVYLDTIGTLPTADETRVFLKDRRSDRRAKLVDDLLKRPEFADFWALRWSDILRVERLALGHKRAYAYSRWIRESLASNKPYDQFCREILTAEGPLTEVPAGNIYKVVTNPGSLASTMSQVFLGIRIECAQCHHHPFDRWSQTDYFGMQAFFTQVSFKGTGKSESLLAAGNGGTNHPRTGEVIFAHGLGTEMPKEQLTGDRRKVLAAWMTAPENPYFARNIVNRTWAHFVGRGLVEPVDDVRLTNPPNNAELLDALTKHFIEKKFDFQDLIRTITASRVYQLSSEPNATNERDDQNYSRALFKRLDAEVLLDAVCQVTNVPEKYQGVPAGSRAIQLWDSQIPHYFLKLFGRPSRSSTCECERVVEPSVAQVLHVMNSPEIQAKLSHVGGRLVHLISENNNDEAVVEEMYLTYFNRFPTETEKKSAAGYLKSHAEQRQQAAEDIAWSMMNSSEFLFNH